MSSPRRPGTAYTSAPRFAVIAACALLGLAGQISESAAQSASAQSPSGRCANPGAIGVSRIVEVDAAKGQVHGGITQAPSTELLRPKEVVLTFDDGPFDGLTRQILDTLDQHCTKAMFFVVGQMALARPAIVREEIARGHTVGTHTWSHPMPMKALPIPAQIEEIDKGIAAASRVAGKGLAPFFRFPGLGDSPETLAHLKTRGIATFTVDIVSNDSFIADPAKLAERTMNILAGKGKGILLFHDIKASTAAALPMILDQLKQGGYRIVHVVPKGQGGGKRPPLVASAPEAAGERLPWGMAHQGPMPVILPPVASRGVTAAGSSSPAPSAVLPPVAPARPKPQPKDGPGDWLNGIFGSNDKS